MSEDLNTVTKVNFAEKKAEEKWNVEPEKGIPKFLKDCAKYAKDKKVTSVLVMMIDQDEDVDWVFHTDNDHHKALMCLTLEDVRGDIKADLFNETETDI